jgi:uncharacterized membrane protein
MTFAVFLTLILSVVTIFCLMLLARTVRRRVLLWKARLELERLKAEGKISEEAYRRLREKFEGDS